MNRIGTSTSRSIDWMTFSLYLSLIGVGWLMIYAVGYNDETNVSTLIGFDTNIGKQSIWIILSVLVFFITQLINWKFWRTFAIPIYGVTVLFLFLVLLFGIKVKGATSWFSIMGFTLQPSEFAKFGTCIALASYLSNYAVSLKNIRSQFVTVGIIAVPIVLILLQPDAGSAIVFFSFLLMLFRAGASALIYIMAIVAIALFILGLIFDPFQVILGMLIISVILLIFSFKNKIYWLLSYLLIIAVSIFLVQQDLLFSAIILNIFILFLFSFLLRKERKGGVISRTFVLLIIGGVFTFSASYAVNNILKPHQQDRINVWLRPHLCDPQGSLYNVLQSKLTIGSGGLEGKGFLQGMMTKLNYVPEQTTDFIFCTIGEEQGFIGSVGIIGLFFLLLMRIVILAERQRSDFSRHYAYGVAGILFLHIFINIGMTMGLVPIIGIPLPFISYGGSSILGFTLLIGVLLKLDSQRLSS